MIRIETVATFDEDGRFTGKYPLSSSIPPGRYDVVISVDETVLSPEEAANFQPSFAIIEE
jgi:hypothetical protein